jgi:hypothetical protein
MSAQAAPFAHIHQTSFNVEAIDRRTISHIPSLQGHKRRSRQARAESGLSQTDDVVASQALFGSGPQREGPNYRTPHPTRP